MKQVHETISGQRIELEPTTAEAAFLARAQAIASDKKRSVDELVALVYGAENPILERRPQGSGRSEVTRATLEHPVYLVLCDLLDRKEAAAAGLTAAELAAPYTVTVAEAAAQLGISVDAVRKAIAARRLPAWVKGSQYYLDPETFELLGEVGKRGPTPAKVAPLRVRAGFNGSAKLEVKAPGEPIGSARAVVEGTISRWRRVGVVTGAVGRLRFFELVPDDQEEEITLGELFVRGRFKIARKENNAARARAAWEEFRAA